MKSPTGLKHGDTEHEVYVDPVLTKETRHLQKKFEIIRNAITPEESLALKNYISSKITESSNSKYSNQLVLPYRPDEWDEFGVIQKIQDIAKGHILETYPIIGQLEPRKFMILRTDNVQTYKETYGLYNANSEILYTAIVTPSSPTDYFSGETLYTVNGEGFYPNPRDMVVQRNEELNSWEIIEVLSGTRFDLVVVFQEIDRTISYNYTISQDDYCEDF
jgi:hypothetical protein